MQNLSFSCESNHRLFVEFFNFFNFWSVTKGFLENFGHFNYESMIYRIIIIY